MMMLSSCDNATSHATVSTGMHDESSCCLTEKLLHLADEAWAELMKEKIKHAMEESCGEAMTKMAKAAACARKTEWQAKLEAKFATKKASHGLKEAITSVLSHCETTCHN